MRTTTGRRILILSAIFVTAVLTESSRADLPPQWIRDRCARQCVRKHVALTTDDAPVADVDWSSRADYDRFLCRCDEATVLSISYDTTCRRTARAEAAAFARDIRTDCEDEFTRVRCSAPTAAAIATCWVGVRTRHDTCRRDVEVGERRLRHALLRACTNQHPSRQQARGER